MMRPFGSPIPVVRDTKAIPAKRTRGASPAQKEPSAPALALRLVANGLSAVPWRQVVLTVVVAATAGLMPWAVAQGLGYLDRDFSRVEIVGEPQRVSASHLHQHLEPLMGASYFATDLSEVKSMVEMLPWVSSAAVGREWPGVLTVSVLEHEPAAHWNGQSLLSQQGVVFHPVETGNASLPELYGPPGKAQQVLDQSRAFSQELATLDLSLESLRLEARGAWTLLLDNGIRVSLGRDRVDERFQRFMTVYESRLAPVAAGINGVDARYGNGVAVRWRDS